MNSHTTVIMTFTGCNGQDVKNMGIPPGLFSPVFVSRPACSLSF